LEVIDERRPKALQKNDALKNSHYRKTGTIIGTGEIEEDGVDARIDVSGTVTYFDVFGGQHILQVRQYSMSLDDDGWSLRDTTSSLRFVRESEF
jgi:hypothetical protein